jgi:DNA-binding transcriptional MerR regulator
MKKGTKKKTQTKPTKPTKPKKEADDNFYTKEEIERLDAFHSQTNGKFDDEEIYELMEKYKQDDEAILNELKELLKERERGAEYDWQEVGKSN